MNQSNRELVTQQVNKFYSLLPFNLNQTAQQGCETIQRRNQIKDAYPYLDSILKATKNAKILDVGCGAGWFVNTIAYHYALDIVGIDACESAINRASEVSKQLSLKTRVRYYCVDLFNINSIRLNDTNKFYLVNTLGVLHHTYDCRQALLSILNLVEDGGFIHIGLYHKYGRRPFLELFQKYREEWEASSSESRRREIEEQAFLAYRELNFPTTEETLLRSWFRDQVLHPHESQHTFQEVYYWLTECGFQCVTTSINQFQRVRAWEGLFNEEKKMYDLSYKRNYEEKSYFPGFFVVLAQKKPGKENDFGPYLKE